jgi:hypothetical protein
LVWATDLRAQLLRQIEVAEAQPVADSSAGTTPDLDDLHSRVVRVEKLIAACAMDED